MWKRLDAEKPIFMRERLVVEEPSPIWERLEAEKSSPIRDRLDAEKSLIPCGKEEPSPKWERLDIGKNISHMGEACLQWFFQYKTRLHMTLYPASAMTLLRGLAFVLG
ncbi:hypothetical protein Adt_18559 [Abeliophyllum distichum]|uniref:Uncharacterized protein n=1 Tax=Abeliophyllum distichum TaxID=126358 RepID=A0ABD1TJR1_9LAMI